MLLPFLRSLAIVIVIVVATAAKPSAAFLSTTAMPITSTQTQTHTHTQTSIMPSSVVVETSALTTSLLLSSKESQSSSTTTTTTTTVTTGTTATASSDDASSLCSERSITSSTTTSGTGTDEEGRIYVCPPEKSLRHALGVADQEDPVVSSSLSSLSQPLLPILQGTSATTSGSSCGTCTTTSPWIVGHRGALYQELENTRASFDACASMVGCHAVEMDVFLLPKCGTLVVFHGGGTDENPGDLSDYCLDRPGQSILDLTYEEALRLEFNPSFAEFPCPAKSIQRGSIPTLEQVLQDAKQSGLHLKLELKGPGTVEPTLAFVEQLEMVDHCSYSSFDLSRLAHLRQLRPDRHTHPTGALFNEVPANYLELAMDCGATEVHLRYDTCTKERVRAIHNAGLGSMLWMRGAIGMASDCITTFWDVGNEDFTMYETLLQTGVQQVCINKPDVLLEYLRRQQQEQQTEPHQEETIIP